MIGHAKAFLRSGGGWVGAPLQKPPSSALSLPCEIVSISQGRPLLAPEFTTSGQEEAGKGLKISVCGGSSLHATPFRQEAAVHWMPMGHGSAVPLLTNGACTPRRMPLTNGNHPGIIYFKVHIRFIMQRLPGTKGEAWRAPSPAEWGKLGGDAPPEAPFFCLPCEIGDPLCTSPAGSGEGRLEEGHGNAVPLLTNRACTPFPEMPASTLVYYSFSA
jgi:hypothetical protein